jgi:L-asparaginase II
MVAVVDASGTILLERGNIQVPIFPRSTLKPLQTLAVGETGIGLTPLETVLTTASHCGSQDHRTAIAEFLARHSLSEDHLQCPPDWPLGSDERLDVLQRGGQKTRLAMNCSGKHAGFLAASQHAGFDLTTYLAPEHPLQKVILATLEHWSGEKVTFSSTDGCGAPLHQLSLLGLARAIARIASGEDEASKSLVQAIAEHPWALDGHGRANTLTVQQLGGIAKIGAEGLVVIGLPSGVAVALKILDGSMRATTPVALEALVRIGAIENDTRDHLVSLIAEPVWGGEKIIGALQVKI